MNEENKKIDFEEYKKRKQKLMKDFDRVILEAHNEHYLHTPDIVGACTIVLFTYMSGTKLLVSDVKSDEDNKDRGVFV